MSQPATISPLTIVPDATPAPVKHLMTAEEKEFLDLIADLIVKDILKPDNEDLQNVNI